MSAVHRKVATGQLGRDAYLYVRRSSLRQVFENVECGPDEIAERLGVAGSTIQRWRKAGFLRAHVYCDAG